METLYALRTYDEILIAVRAQLHIPVARPKSLLTGEEMKVEGTANCGQAAESAGGSRIDLLRMTCPLGGMIVL